MSNEQKQNLENSVKKPEQNAILDKMRTEFAQPPAIADSEENKAILSFRSGDFYVGLKIVNKLNPRTGRNEDMPQLTTTFGKGNFYSFPINGEWWAELAAFATKMSHALEGVSRISVNSSGDEDYAKNLMAQFKD